MIRGLYPKSNIRYVYTVNKQIKMSNTYSNCQTGVYGIIFGAVQDKTCETCTNLVATHAKSTQQKIWGTVRVPASEYTMNRGALNVYTRPVSGYNNVNWNQMSDRAVAGVVRVDVPTHGCSTRSSITRMRPGSTSAAGKGVDVKHGSYDRYLARLKGRGPVKTQLESTAAAVPLTGNKTMKYGIVMDAKCRC